MRKSKKKVFIGSSAESLHIATELKKILSTKFKDIKFVLWKETDWKNLESILDNLNDYLNDFSYSIFIAYPDDVLFERKKVYYSTRDNVIFEFGYFLSVLGKERTFLLIPKKLDYDGNTPIQIKSATGKGIKELGYQPTFKLMSDFGTSLNTDKYDLKHKITAKKDKWYAYKLASQISTLTNSIQKTEDARITLSNKAVTEIEKKGKNFVSDIEDSTGLSDEQISSKFLKAANQLLFLRSKASKKPIWNSASDVINLMYKIEDLLDIKQLCQKQNFKEVKKVWVFADKPIEFDNGTDRKNKSILINTIIKNIKNGVKYKYITSDSFDVDRIQESLFDSTKDNYLEDKFKKSISIIKVEPKFFKTYFTIHFDSQNAINPFEIYMSALLPHRQDLLMKVSNNHSERVFERINKLVGSKPNGEFYIREYVVK